MNKKKILIFALTLALCGSALVSCVGNGGNEGDSSSESATKAEEKETGEGDKKSARRGMNDITGRVSDGVENIKNGVMNGVEGIKNGVVNGIGAVKRDVKKGADNVKDSIMDGTLDTEDATHGIEYGSDMGGNSESESRMPITHRERIPSGK